MTKTKVIIILSLVAVFLSTFVLASTPLGYYSGGYYSARSLVRFGSYDELKTFLLTSRPSYSYGMERGLPILSSEGNSYSGTNVQVAGVDEGDIVKTDGEYIYLIANGKVFIIRAYPAQDAIIVSEIAINGTLRQMYINNDRLIVFYEEGPWNEVKTVTSIYDVSDRENPHLMREVAVDGTYFSSRMIEDYVYVIVRKTANVVDDTINLPEISFNGENITVTAMDIYHSTITDYYYVFTMVAAINIFDDFQRPEYSPILAGAATTIYVSEQNIYLTSSSGDETTIQRVHIADGMVSFEADGQVPGTILNQFSMDEHADTFRIATTSYSADWQSSTSLLGPVQNNLYVLDMNLNIIGELEEIAPGEKIHSVRFMENRAYVVTFKKIDPFFVIDLSNAYAPTVLGELKISGYSDYLHPYDENHIIGIGKETYDMGDFAWYQGVKISLFDVTDVSNPRELAKYEIGNRGTDSPVLYDHKAFLFNPENGLLAMPVSVATIDESQYPNGVPPNTYGELVWQGAYVFTVSLESQEKIRLKGTVTHIENEDIHNSTYYVTRTLYINEVLYTISQAKIKMNLLSDISEINEITISG